MFSWVCVRTTCFVLLLRCGDSVTECPCEMSDTYHLKIVVEISAQDVIVSRDSEDYDFSLFINFDSLCKLSSLLLYFKHVLIKK